MQRTPVVSELVSLLFSPPGTSTTVSSTVNDNEIRICEPTLFHATRLPLDGQLESNRAAPQTPNPALHGTCDMCVIKVAEYMQSICDM